MNDILSGESYPWQVAPQQSLFPFQFNNAKFKSVIYIYNLSKLSAIYRIKLVSKK